MAGAASEKNPTHVEQELKPFLSPGVARFMVAAGGDLTAKKYFNPNPLPLDTMQIEKRIKEGEPADVDIDLVETLSFALREGTTTQQERQGKSKKEQATDWAENMVSFLKLLSPKASDELKAVSRKRLGVDLSQTNDAVLWEQVSGLWDKYLAGGSNIERFFTDVLTGIYDLGPPGVAEMQHRIELVGPFLGMFGDERIHILAKDAFHAFVLLRVGQQQKGNFGPLVVDSLRQHFRDETQKAAYQLVWDVIKDKIPDSNPSPRPTPTSSPPASPVASSVAQSPQQPHSAQTDSATATSKGENAQSLDKKDQTPSQAAVSPSPGGTEKGQSRSTTQSAPRNPVLGLETQKQHTPVESEKQPSSSRSGAVVLRNPEKPWAKDDALLVKEFADGGFVLGAFDGLEKGGVYSGALAGKLRQLAKKHIGVSNHMDTVEVSVREAIAALSELESFEKRVKQGAEKELIALNIGEKQRQEMVSAIGATGLLAIAAKDKGQERLVTINVGPSRLIAYNPLTGSIETLVEEQLMPQDRLRRPPKLFRSSDQQFLDSHTDKLSHFVQKKDIAELEKEFERQRKKGWSEKEALLRVFPLEKGRIYLIVTNGITLNIPPRDLPRVIERAYRHSEKTGTLDMQQMVSLLAKEVQIRMRRPESYRLEIRGREKAYVVQDTAGIVGLWYH